MSGKMMSPNAYRVGTRAREPRRIKEPEGLDGSARGSIPKKKADDKPVKAKPGLVIDQARWQKPPTAAASKVLHRMQKHQAI